MGELGKIDLRVQLQIDCYIWNGLAGLRPPSLPSRWCVPSTNILNDIVILCFFSDEDDPSRELDDTKILESPLMLFVLWSFVPIRC